MEIRIKTDEVVTVPEAARQLGKPKMTLYRWIHAGKIISIEFGGILFIPKNEVERLSKVIEEGKEKAAKAVNPSG